VDVRFAARLGHGLGLDLTEPPSLSVDEETVLEPGMALTIEPGVLTPEGWCHLEENVVVRDAGCEFLSARMPRELPVTGD
jgi:Xaa-Pro aminopeptidase